MEEFIWLVGVAGFDWLRAPAALAWDKADATVLVDAVAMETGAPLLWLLGLPLFGFLGRLGMDILGRCDTVGLILAVAVLFKGVIIVFPICDPATWLKYKQ